MCTTKLPDLKVQATRAYFSISAPITMSLLNIQDQYDKTQFSFFVLGFRPFFLAAGAFSILSIVLWMGIYGFGLDLDLGNLPAIFWHAHEMVYGYALAVIAGFLLTAIRNWTGIQTLQYKGLILLLILWAMARLTMLTGQTGIAVAAVFDLGFNLFLFGAALSPVIRVRQWKQVGIISKLLLMAIGNLLFYAGAIGWLNQGVYLGTYIGLFLVIALVLTMGRRVIPFFIEKGVPYPVKLRNSQWLDLISLFGFLAFALNQLFLHHTIGVYLAVLLFVVTTWRLVYWHTPGIWSRPLLWGLYTALISIDIGFLLYALTAFFSAIHESLALHAMAFGGIGLVTLSMMSRVTLGHTGRDILQPSKWIAVAQGMLLLGLLFRIGLPLLFPQHYVILIITAQVFWILGFALFLIVNAPLLLRPRIDGAPG
jgi:uncharacterized protein involved in response to NO